MAVGDLTVEFDPENDDDVSAGDILEALKAIKADTNTLAELARKKANETPTDKNIQTQANQKSRLEENDKYQNQNQGKSTQSTDLVAGGYQSFFANSPHQQIMEALATINYSILGLGASFKEGVKAGKGRNESSDALEIETPRPRYVEAEVVDDEKTEGGETKQIKSSLKNTPKSKKNTGIKAPSQFSPIHNAGTDLADEKIGKLSAHYNRFKEWYTRGMSDDEVAAAMTKGSSTFDPILGMMGSLEGIVGKIVPAVGIAAAAIGAVGKLVEWGRSMQQDELNQGVGAGGAIGNTLSDAGEDIAHKLGFTANTGEDLQKYRQEALANNWALYGKKADTYFDARKWATDAGLTTQAETNWIQEMTALGLSTNQIKLQFEGLSEVSKQVGVSFQNLSKAVAEESTESEKLFGKQGSKGTEEGEVQVQEADNLFGLNSGTIGKMALTSSGQNAMAQVLIASGHAGQEAASVGSPQEMYANIVKDHLGTALAKSMMAQAYQTAIGTTYSANPEQNRQDQEEAFVRNLSKFYGISASDFKNSGMTAFKQMGNGSLSASSTYAGSLTRAGMAQAEKEIPTIKTNIEIGLSKGMEAKIANSNGVAKGLFDTEGTNNYFHIQNKWLLDR